MLGRPRQAQVVELRYFGGLSIRDWNEHFGHSLVPREFDTLGGFVTALLGRIRSYQDKDFWGTLDNARHGKKARHDFDHYIATRLTR